MTQRDDPETAAVPTPEPDSTTGFRPGPGESPEADALPPTQPGPAGWETDASDETSEAGR